MKEVYGDLWRYYGQPGKVCCITTNGLVTSRGACVMGRGNALQAKKKVPGIDYELGGKIQELGNVPHYLDGGRIFSFPVKHAWYLDADPDLIRDSALVLAKEAEARTDYIYILPRPGCSNGHLRWEDVRLILEPHLVQENVWVITNEA